MSRSVTSDATKRNLGDGLQYTPQSATRGLIWISFRHEGRRSTQWRLSSINGRRTHHGAADEAVARRRECARRPSVHALTPDRYRPPRRRAGMGMPQSSFAVADPRQIRLWSQPASSRTRTREILVAVFEMIAIVDQVECGGPGSVSSSVIWVNKTAMSGLVNVLPKRYARTTRSTEPSGIVGGIEWR